MSRAHGKSYVDQMLALLAEFDFQINVHFPKGEVDGVDSRIMTMDDIALEDRARMKDANFELHYGGNCPISDVDYSRLEQRIEAAWGANGRRGGTIFHGDPAQLPPIPHDAHVVQRKRKMQAKQREIKAAIKSRQLRNRKKGR